ncbi:MAG: type II secretion system GspH family protein [Magnetococcus sp. DMHC-1]
MKTANRKSGQGQEGFTLIELLIVILVIGILGGIAVTQFGDVTGTARTNATAIQTRVAATYQACSDRVTSAQAAGADAATIAAAVTAMCGAAPQ